MTTDPLAAAALRSATVDALRSRSATALLLAADSILSADDMTAPDLAHTLCAIAESARDSAPQSSCGSLAGALSAAQSRARGVAPDATNTHHHYDYASAEAIIAAATAALTDSDLALYPRSTSIDGELLQRRWVLEHASGEQREISQVWPLAARRGMGPDKVLAGALTSSFAYLLRDLLMMPRVESSDDSLHDERGSAARAAPDDAPPSASPQDGRGAPWVEGVHNPSFAADRAGFCAALRDCGGLRYETVADALEADGKGRPSWWPHAWRVRLIDALRAGRFPDLYTPESAEAGQ